MDSVSKPGVDLGNPKMDEFHIVPVRDVDLDMPAISKVSLFYEFLHHREIRMRQ
jgi:hypothetical protein